MNQLRVQIKQTVSIATAILVAALSPFIALGANFDESGGLTTFFSGAVGFINGILIPAILALAFLVFVWGVFLYFVRGGADDEAQSKGKQLMLYAIGGFVLILIFFGIVNLLESSIGLGGGEITPPATISI